MRSPGSTVRLPTSATVIRNTQHNQHSLQSAFPPSFDAFHVDIVAQPDSSSHRPQLPTPTMASGQYDEQAPSHPSVDDLPDDIRDLLENYGGVKAEDVIGHVVDVVCTVLSIVQDSI